MAQNSSDTATSIKTETDILLQFDQVEEMEYGVCPTLWQITFRDNWSLFHCQTVSVPWKCEHLESIFCLLSLHVLYVETQLSSVDRLSLGSVFNWLFAPLNVLFNARSVLVKYRQIMLWATFWHFVRSWCARSGVLGRWGYFSTPPIPPTKYKQFSQDPV